ncbi:MAG: trypsin-like serine peptidase, partial [Planctomycetaceae bacterium]
MARLFFSPEKRTGGRLDWQSRGGTVVMDFGLEARTRSDKRQRVVERVVFAPPDEIPELGPIQHHLPDVAILQLKRERGAYLPEPLPLLTGVEPQPNQELLIIGHPSKDLRYPEQGQVGEALKVVFGAQYGLKRVAPGQYNRLPNPTGSALRSGARSVAHRLAHDASTLGGNSGSPVLLLAPGAGCLGLHYAGQVANEPTDEANWAQDFFALKDVPNTVPGQPPTLGDFFSRV